MNKIEIGSKVPEFKLLDQNGVEFDIKNVIGKSKLVIYFYPKDETPGCTKEACAFRDQYDVFQQADAVVIGISAQSVESHKSFAENHRLPFTLLSDPEKEVRKLFGVHNNLLGALPGRITYVADKTGTVVYIFDSQTEAVRHVDEALRIIKEMK
jgi:thioredoxin-dependent peroxiredoxin